MNRPYQPKPSRSQNQNACDNRRYRTERVTDDVKPRAAHIEVVLVVAVQKICGNQIN